jgi:hypothetical protein
MAKVKVKKFCQGTRSLNVPAFVKIGIYSISLIYCFLVFNKGQNVSTLITNPFKLITEPIQSLLQPRIERNFFKDPEAFMTTVLSLVLLEI